FAGRRPPSADAAGAGRSAGLPGAGRRAGPAPAAIGRAFASGADSLAGSGRRTDLRVAGAVARGGPGTRALARHARQPAPPLRAMAVPVPGIRSGRNPYGPASPLPRPDGPKPAVRRADPG